MAAVLLFWDTNMAAVTSCENTLYIKQYSCYHGWGPIYWTRFILVAVKYKPMICTTILTTLQITDENKNIYINSYIRAPLTFESVNWSLIFIELVAPKTAVFFCVPQSIHCRFFSFFLFLCFWIKLLLISGQYTTSLSCLVTGIYLWAVHWGEAICRNPGQSKTKCSVWHQHCSG